MVLSENRVPQDPMVYHQSSHWEHLVLPSGFFNITIEHGPLIVDLPMKVMVIFHRYVKLPEGTLWHFIIAIKSYPCSISKSSMNGPVSSSLC